MPRQTLTYIGQKSFRGGINQEPENLRPNQVLDAKNMWVRNGKLVKRPGTQGVDMLHAPTGASSFDANWAFVDTSGTDQTSTAAVSATWAVGDIWYIGQSAAWTTPIAALDVVETTFGGLDLAWTSSTSFKTSYWNGTAWVELPLITLMMDTTTASNFSGLPNFISAGNDWFFILPYIPSDWATTIIDSADYYWLRIELIGEDLTTSSAFIPAVVNITGIDETSVAPNVGSTFIQLSNDSRRAGMWVDTSQVGFTLGENRNLTAPVSAATNAEPATWAVIPEFSKVYVAYDNQVYDLPIDGSTNADVRALVNSDTTIVGDTGGSQESDVLYDKDTVAQADVFPAANYITYFNGRMWAAGLDSEPFTIRWSGPSLDGAYNVWPTVSFEILSENDNSPITGLGTLNEHLVVFKQDSIWLMVFTGTNELGLATFRPVKVVSGKGAVSQGSIQEVNGRLIFMAEDGFYEFDGTPNVKKLSGAVDEEFAKIVPGRRRFSTAAHWSTENIYVCAVATEGSQENNFAFVYDYKNMQQGEDGRPVGAWWFWEDWNVQSWLLEEDRNDEEKLYYVDNTSRVFKVAPNLVADAGQAISSEVTTHRIGYGDGQTKRWRDFRLHGHNSTTDVTVEFINQDEPQGSNTVTYSDSLEAKWNTAVWNTDTWVRPRRRERVHRLRQTGEWLQTKISHSTAEPLEITGIRYGIKPLGIR